MTVNWIDHVVLVVPSLEAAAEPYERLGFHLTPVTRHAGLGTENRALFVGDGTNDFYVEFLAVHDRDTAMAAAPERTERYVSALEGAGGIARLMLGSTDIASVQGSLAAAGYERQIESVAREGGGKICDVLDLEGIDGLGMAAGVIAYTEGRTAQHERRAGAGYFAHDFPLKRLDHLAAMAPELQRTTEAWSRVLNVGVHGVVEAGPMVIHQMKMGDAILELLGPATEDSPMRQRPAGLASMVAWEVDGLDAAVASARSRGFEPSEPRPGPLPGTRVATIPADQLSGVSMQLLEYV